MSKTCTKCKIEKSLDEFTKDSNSKDGKRPSCRLCKKNKDKLQRELFPEEIRKKDREKYNNKSEEDKKKILESRRAYKESVKDTKVKIWRLNELKKKKERFKNDPNYKLLCLMRSRIKACLKKEDASKKNKSIDYLGCSTLYFRNWIEFQFTKEMTWDNHGIYWHLDHVIPCSSFDFSKNEDINKCFIWKNMRPLSAQDNLSKSDKIDNDLIKKHFELAEIYQLENNNLFIN